MPEPEDTDEYRLLVLDALQENLDGLDDELDVLETGLDDGVPTLIYRSDHNEGEEMVYQIMDVAAISSALYVHDSLPADRIEFVAHLYGTGTPVRTHWHLEKDLAYAWDNEDLTQKEFTEAIIETAEIVSPTERRTDF